MWKKFFSVTPDIPISKAEFRKQFFLQTGLCWGGFLLLSAFLQFRVISRVEMLVAAIFLVSLTLFALPKLMTRRLQDVYPEDAISGLAIAFYSVFPVLNVPLIHLCFTRETGSASWIPPRYLARERYAVFIFLFMMSLSSLFGFVSGSEKILPVSAWVLNPSAQKMSFVAAEARVIMETKRASQGKNIFKELARVQRELAFDGTGKVLAVAVIASEILRRKKSLVDRNPATGSLDSLIFMVEGISRQETFVSQHRRLWEGFSPLALLSAANLMEAGMLLLIEEKIELKYRELAKERLLELVATGEKVTQEKKLGDDYVQQLTRLRGAINANFAAP